MSKPVTALAALKLVEQGVLDLDTDVNKQLKSWHVPENDFTREHAVDLRGLLSHTAGLTVHGFPGYAVGDPLPTVPEILDGLKPANTAPVRVDKVPGQGFRYSGGGTTIVQQLLTDVTQRAFADLMREMVLAPLGMSSSTFEQPIPEDRQQQAATAHNDQGKPVAGRWHIYPEQAPAGLWTTPSDMARYAIEVQVAHEGKSQKILSREMTDKMLTPQGGGPVGLGPFLVERGTTRRFEHSGGNAGFGCEYIAILDRGQGAVVMTNSDSGGRTVNEIMNSIAAAYNWPDFLPPEREPAQVDRRVFDRLVGDYALNVASVATISRRGDRLLVKLPRQAEIELYPLSDTAFFTEQSEVKGDCVLDEQGQVVAVVFNFGGREVRAKRVP
jgi:CubicO group peptidase (beta-lactamase class C family)